MKILTFDIEDWFHILDHSDTRYPDQWDSYPPRLEENLDRILALLDKHQCPATFFCLGWVAERYPGLIRKISDFGYHIGSHSYGHQLAYQQTHSEFRSDLRRSIKAISDATGANIDTYRAPGFSITGDNLWVFDILSEEGIKVDCSVFPANRAHGGIPGFETDKPCIIEVAGGARLHEFPITSQAIGPARMMFSGGGYFRLLPYSVLRRMFERHPYVMTYFHPRDLDPEQPVLPNLSWKRRFKSYVGLRGSHVKLDRLLKEFEFMDVRAAAEVVNWEECESVCIDDGCKICRK